MAIFEVLNNQQSYFNRYFRRNEGTTDYATIPAVTLAEGDVITFLWLAPTSITTGAEYVFDGDATGLNRAPMILQTNGTIDFGFSWVNSYTIDGINQAIGGSYPTDGKLHCVSIVCGVNANGRNIGTIYSRFGASNYLSGILANLKIYDNGTLIRDYPINDNSSTIRDLANGQNGTIVNGNASDWGLFDKQANGDWKGNGLAVPPWDSVDQVLVTA